MTSPICVRYVVQADKKYDKLRSERQERVDQLEDPETRYLMTTAAIAETRKEILQLDRQLVKMGHVVSLRREEVKCIREPLTELAANKRVRRLFSQRNCCVCMCVCVCVCVCVCARLCF